MTVDALLERHLGKQVIDRDGRGFLNFAVDHDRRPAGLAQDGRGNVGSAGGLEQGGAREYAIDQAEFAGLVAYILGSRYLNGETIRLDGAVRLAPK